MKPGDMIRTQGIKTLYNSFGSTRIIGEIPWKTTGIILQVHNSWLLILTSSGITAWCSNVHIKVIS